MDKATNTISNKMTKYNCRVLLQIQSVYCNKKDIIEDIDYYPQVFFHSVDMPFLPRIN